MNGGRIWLLLGGVVGVVVIALGWLAGASPLFAQADQADTQRRDVEAQNQQYEATLAQMKALDGKKDELILEYGELKDSVPATLDLEGYFDWVAVAANEATVTLAAAAANSGEDYKPADGAAGTVKLDSNFQTTLRLVQVTISAGGDVEQIATFLHLLQSDGRLQLITSANIALGSSLTTQITGYIFVIDDPRLVALNAVLGGGSGVNQPGDTPSPDPSDTASPDPSDTPTSSDTPTPAARR